MAMEEIIFYMYIWIFLNLTFILPGIYKGVLAKTEESLAFPIAEMTTETINIISAPCFHHQWKCLNV